MTEAAHQQSIILPWPDKRLSPNARVHWAEEARVKKRARLEAAWEARAYGAHILHGKPCDFVRVVYTFHPPDRRRRDLDNLVASMKAAADGVADVIGIDDSRWRFQAEFGEPKTDGEVFLSLKLMADNCQPHEGAGKGEGWGG